MSEGPFTALGIDVGGTKTAACIVTFPDCALHERRTIATKPRRGGKAVLQEVEQMVGEMCGVSAASGRPVEGIGVGVCEIVDRDGQIVSANCIQWTSPAVQETLSKFAPTVIEADVRAGAIAESLYGAGKGKKVFLYISIGTGIASCLVVEGKAFTGSRGATGTMASGPLPGFCDVAGGKLLPTLEEVASGPALVRRFNELGGAAANGEDVLAAAGNGDSNAATVVCSGAACLGASIGSLVNVLDPELVILGGGLGTSEGLFREHLILSARRHIWWEGHRDVPIVPAQTRANAGLIGAAASAWGRFSAS